MERTQQKQNKNPDSPSKNSEMQKVYMKALDYRRCSHSTGLQKLIYPSKRLPENGIMFLNEVTYDPKS
jgi:hypothetical protein